MSKFPIPTESLAERAKRVNGEWPQHKWKSLPLLIPAWIDDAELTPNQFRVLCRIARRCGKDSQCHESLDGIASGCKIRRETVQSAIKALKHLGWITAEQREGQTTIYHLAPTVNEGLGSTPIAKEGLPTHRKRGATHPPQRRGY